MSWTPSHLARDLDSSLRRPGWGLIFTGLPGGIQLQAPNPHAGRLVLCSSAYWSGGEMVDGKITKVGDVLSRYSYSIISDEWATKPHTRLCSRHSHCLPIALSCSHHLECCCT